MILQFNPGDYTMINFQLRKGYWSSLFFCLLKGSSYFTSTYKMRYNEYIPALPTNATNIKALTEEMRKAEYNMPTIQSRQLYEQAYQCYNNQKVIDAMQNLNKAISIDNNCEQAYFLIANIMLQQSKFQQAIQYYQEVFRINPDNSDAYNNVGIALQKQGDISEALRAFQISFSLNDQDYRVNNNLGVIYLVHLQNIAQAARYLRNAAYFNPSGFQQYLQTGKQLYDQQKYLQSISFLINAFFRNIQSESTAKLLKDNFLLAERVSQGREFYTWLINNGMENYSIYYSLGSLLFQFGQIQESRAFLQKAIQLDDQSYETNLYLATVYAKSGNNARAIKHYENCTTIQPNNSIAYSSLGIIHLQLENLSKAASAFTKAVGINQKDAVAWSGLGSILLRKGQVQEGIDHLKKAIQMDPTNYPALQKIGNTLYLLGREKEGNFYLSLAGKIINDLNSNNNV